MIPADQGFHAPDALAFHGNLRLVEDLEFLLLQGMAHFVFDRQTPGERFVQILGEELVIVSTVILGVIHGDIGVFDQRLDVVAVVRKIAMPMLMPAYSSWPSMLNGCFSEARIFCAI
jgi:hypothetical protein